MKTSLLGLALVASMASFAANAQYTYNPAYNDRYNDRYEDRYQNQRYQNQNDRYNRYDNRNNSSDRYDSNRYGPNRYDSRSDNRVYSERDEGRRFSDGTYITCRDVVVSNGTRDPNRVGGTVAGAVIGGVLGNQIGSGNGRKAATIGGAIAGGAIGRHVQGNRQESNGGRVIERRCERVY